MPIPDTLRGIDDLVRVDFEAYRDFWFHQLLFATLLVVVGLVLEGPELWYEITSIIRIPKFTTPEKHAPNWVKLLAIIGWLLIVGGVAGEYVADSFVSKGDGFVQKFDEILLADAQKKTGAASERAAKAFERAAQTEREASQENERAAKAEQQATEENARAAKALEAAETARKNAEGFSLQIAQANERAANAEARAAQAQLELARIAAPRSLTNVPGLVAALKPFNGTEYTLNVFMDTESMEFTKVVARTFEAAGWVRKQPTGTSIGIPTVEIAFDQGGTEYVPACLETGISLHAHSKESLATLQLLPVQSMPRTVQAALALKSAIALSISPSDERNVVSGILEPKPAEGIPMTICVGKKP